MVTTRPPKTIVKPTALGPVANTDTKLLIYGLFQKGRVLAQDGVSSSFSTRASAFAMLFAGRGEPAMVAIHMGLSIKLLPFRLSELRNVLGCHVPLPLFVNSIQPFDDVGPLMRVVPAFRLLVGQIR